MFAAWRCGGPYILALPYLLLVGNIGRGRWFLLWKTAGKVAAQDCCHTIVICGLTMLPLLWVEGAGWLFYSGKELGRVMKGT